MRWALANPVTPLLGSLGLHGCVALALVLAVRHPAPRLALDLPRPDAWAGNAVEVDAVATPNAVASSPSDALANAASTAVQSPESPAAPTGPALTSRSAPQPAPKTPAEPADHRDSKGPFKSAATAAAGADSSGVVATPANGAFGGEGLPPGVRSLPSAFTRAIPPATGADPIWQTLPVGSERPFTIAIEVDADGHISSAEILKEKDGTAVETQATHVRERVVALLGGGSFALQSNVGAGRVLFRITITLSDHAVHDEDDPAQLVERGFEPPHGATDGRAYFTLASGRHFEAKVQVLARP
ncbi:MAG TPA: hypothetical protein VK745_22370 [Polyangiaceae bacterium]|nr:hypothetical protein [Polyangiaceae bacterium]